MFGCRASYFSSDKISNMESSLQFTECARTDNSLSSKEDVVSGGNNLRSSVTKVIICVKSVV